MPRVYADESAAKAAPLGTTSAATSASIATARNDGRVFFVLGVWCLDLPFMVVLALPEEPASGWPPSVTSVSGLHETACNRRIAERVSRGTPPMCA